MRVLNIDVPQSLVARWVEWFAPTIQPFLADSDLASSIVEQTKDVTMSDEARDTFALHQLPPGLQHVWLRQEQFDALPRPRRAALVRAQLTHGRELVPSVKSVLGLMDDTAQGQARDQADGHRFVWWRSLLAGHEELVLTDYVEEDRRPSRHDEVPDGVWESAARKLPAARKKAGTFASASGPNCFGTVMAAAGVAGADSVWMLREPFEEWLSETTRPGGDDQEPGTVFVWRSPDGLVQHAAVTLGDDWMLHKPGQGWMEPYKVLTTTDCKASSRAIGRRLERHTILHDLTTAV